jgi:hypothetical protein
VTRNLALLISAALTSFVLIVGAGIAWHLQTAGGDDSAGFGDASTLALAVTADAEHSARGHDQTADDGRIAEGNRSRSADRAMAAESSSRFRRPAAQAAAGDRRSTTRERESRAPAEGARGTASSADAAAPGGAAHRRARADRDD